MRVVTANICNNPDLPDPKMRADINTVAKLGEVIFLQEIGDTTDHEAVRKTFDGGNWDVRNNHVECPIVVSRHAFDVLSAGIYETHHGRPGITPNRYYSWVLAKPLHRPLLHPVVFMNTHFISGAFNAAKDQIEWRKEMWQLHWRKMREKLAEFYDLDYTVILGGDFNRVHVPKFRASQRWAINTGIDKIAVIEGAHGNRVEIVDNHIHPININSDHDAKIATVRLRKPR